MTYFSKCLAGLVLAGTISYNVAKRTSINEYVATVTYKTQSIKNDKYFIFTELEPDRNKVFENTNSLFTLKFNSEAIQDNLKQGETYLVKSYGWNIPYLSQYENILEVKKLN